MTKLTMNDSYQEVFVKMSEGNPGAMACLTEILKNAKPIDPQDALAPFGPILALDTLGIYGTAIYVLWSDKCNRDTRRLVMLLRSYQLGFTSVSTLQKMSEDQMREYYPLTEEQFQELDSKVCERLEEFSRPVVV